MPSELGTARVLSGLRALLPQGRLWNNPNLTFMLFLTAIAEQFDRFLEARENFILESDPGQATELLSDYEKAYLLPLEYPKLDASLASRRETLVAKLLARYPGPTDQFWIDYGASLGIEVEIVPYADVPMDVWNARPTESLYLESGIFVWTILLDTTLPNAYKYMALVQRLNPAHYYLQFTHRDEDDMRNLFTLIDPTLIDWTVIDPAQEYSLLNGDISTLIIPGTWWAPGKWLEGELQCELQNNNADGFLDTIGIQLGLRLGVLNPLSSANMPIDTSRFATLKTVASRVTFKLICRSVTDLEIGFEGFIEGFGCRTSYEATIVATPISRTDYQFDITGKYANGDDGALSVQSAIIQAGFPGAAL